MNDTLQFGLATLVATQALALLDEGSERVRLYRHARALADAAGGPLLIVGAPKGWGTNMAVYPCGDVTIDTDASVCTQCPSGGVLADVREIPYPRDYFGAVFVSHVLEHLPSIADAALAWGELWRVTATSVIVAYPRKLNLLAWWEPTHHLWADQDAADPHKLHVEDRRTGERKVLVA